MSRASQVLPFGEFYGTLDTRRHAPGLEFSVLNADPYRVVERHSHVDVHFAFVLDGLYVSSADGAEAVSSGPQLIFNPAGTTHTDRFETRSRVIDGRFLTLSVAGVHPVHLARVFRKFTGCSPAEFVRQRRLERAQVLVRDTMRPLADIAASCGYADQSHFSNVFRRETGHTPGTCRMAAAGSVKKNTPRPVT